MKPNVSSATARFDCYAVRVVGPAGHVRYLARAECRAAETDDPAQAARFHNPINAWAAEQIYSADKQNIVCDVVNLDDAEDKCT